MGDVGKAIRSMKDGMKGEEEKKIEPPKQITDIHKDPNA